MPGPLTNSIFRHGFRALLLLLFAANTTVSAKDPYDTPANQAIVAQVSNALIFRGQLPVLVRYEWEGSTEKKSRFGTVGFGSFIGGAFFSAGGGGRRYFLGNNPRGLALDLELGAAAMNETNVVDLFVYICPGFGARWTFGEGDGDWTGFILDLRLAWYLLVGRYGLFPFATPYANIGVGFGF